MDVPRVCRVEFISHNSLRKTFVTGRFNVMKAVTICSPSKEYGDKTNETLSSTISAKLPTATPIQVLTSSATEKMPTTSAVNSFHSKRKGLAIACTIEFKQVPYPRQHPLYGLPRPRPFLVCPINEKPIPLIFPTENVKTDTTIPAKDEVTTESIIHFLSSIVHVV